MSEDLVAHFIDRDRGTDADFAGSGQATRDHLQRRTVRRADADAGSRHGRAVRDVCVERVANRIDRNRSAQRERLRSRTAEGERLNHRVRARVDIDSAAGGGHGRAFDRGVERVADVVVRHGSSDRRALCSGQRSRQRADAAAADEVLRTFGNGLVQRDGGAGRRLVGVFGHGDLSRRENDRVVRLAIFQPADRFAVLRAVDERIAGREAVRGTERNVVAADRRLRIER